jgi:hypothetical protein
MGAVSGSIAGSCCLDQAQPLVPVLLQMQGAYQPGPLPAFPSPPALFPSRAPPLESSPPSGGGVFGRKGRKRTPLTTKDCTSIVEGLKRIYFQKVRSGNRRRGWQGRPHPLLLAALGLPAALCARMSPGPGMAPCCTAASPSAAVVPLCALLVGTACSPNPPPQNL